MAAKARRRADLDPSVAEPAPQATTDADDTALTSLSHSERAALDIDAWEPSLLRALLEAQNKLSRSRS